MSGAQCFSAKSSDSINTVEKGVPAIQLGDSNRMRMLADTVRRVAKNNFPVYIYGPTGAGKEWIAQLLHQNGLHASAPFVDVNCGALAENLVESLFFGHVKGAFTGATQHADGYFSLVGEGTLFLDEMGELPLSMQPKLLRVLETGMFRPLGAREPVKFKGRIVVATHRDLEGMVADGRFREDLFHRINVITIHVPPLSERREDIPDLVVRFATEMGKTFSQDAIRFLMSLDWPGNVRELRNTVLRLCVLVPGEQITRACAEEVLASKKPDITQIVDRIAEDILLLDVDNKLALIERVIIDKALQKSSGNKCAAARHLGLHRKNLERRVQSFERNLLAVHREIDASQLHIEAGRYCVAGAYLKSAERLIAELPETVEIDKLRFNLYVKLGVCLRNTGGWAAHQAVACYEQAKRIAARYPDIQELVAVLFGLWVVELVKLNLDSAADAARKLYQLGLNSGQDIVIGHGLAAIANTSFWRGDMDDVARVTDEYLYHRKYRSLVSVEDGFDAYPVCLEFKCLREILLGDFATASVTRKELFLFCQRTQNAFVKTVSLQALTWIAHLLAEFESAAAHAAELLTLSEENNFSFYQGFALIFKGEHLCDENYAAGTEVMRSGFFEYMNPGHGLLFSSYYRCMLGVLQADRGDWLALTATLAEASAIVEQKEEAPFHAKLLLLQARLALASGQLDEAASSLREAWCLAQRNGFRLLQLEIITCWAKDFRSSLTVDMVREFQHLIANFEARISHATLVSARAAISTIHQAA